MRLTTPSIISARHFLQLAPIAGVLLAAGCYPAYNLQRFNYSLLNPSNRICIERGQKQMGCEAGVHYATSFVVDTAKFISGTFYDLPDQEVDSHAVNIRYTIPSGKVGLHAALLSKNLLCLLLQTDLGSAEGGILATGSAGAGVRLYRGRIAGRIVTSIGMAGMVADVHVFERTEWIDYDLVDTYTAIVPFVDVILACNTLIPELPVNPFIGLNLRAHPLFRYEAVRIGMICASATVGVYRDVGPVSIALGLLATRYGNDVTKAVHPGMLIQMTLVGGSTSGHHIAWPGQATSLRRTAVPHSAAEGTEP